MHIHVLNRKERGQYCPRYIMTKTDLINVVAEATGVSKVKAAEGFDALISAITTAVKEGDKVQITGFGTFEQRTRNAREGVNPATGEKIHIAESKVPAFKAGKTFKEIVKG